MKFTLQTQPQEVLKTGIFLVDREKLLRSYTYPDAYIGYEIQPGKLGLRGEFWMGSVGLEGDLGLLIPPAKRDIDVIGYSIQRGEWDWWRFLSCITIPRGGYKVALSFSFSDQTFFDASQDVVSLIEFDQMKEEAGLISTSFSPDTTSVADAWSAVWKVFQREFLASEAEPEYQGL